MRHLCQRCLDGLIVLWGITACIIVSSGRDLLADPGDCDTDCRVIWTAGSVQGTMTVCKQYKFAECGPCGNGCWSDLPAVGGKCEGIDTTQKEATNFVCAILCDNPKAAVYYQATTNVNDFTYKDANKVNECKPKGP